MVAHVPTKSGLEGQTVALLHRNGFVESAHALALCASDASGRVVERIGNIDATVILRSTVKPFIAGAVVRCGAAEAVGFTGTELAIASGSHHGELEHVRIVEAMLEKIGLTAGALACGERPPKHQETAEAILREGKEYNALHDMCSGNHATLLAMARHCGWPIDGYTRADHPVQRALFETYRRVFDVPGELDYAIDGCNIPTLVISLRQLALGFARFASLEGLDEEDGAALLRVRTAMSDFPFAVGGTGSFDSALIARSKGRAMGKIGAEGMYGLAFPTLGIGVAIKVIDGSQRPLPIVVDRVLDQFEINTPDLHGALRPFFGDIHLRFDETTPARDAYSRDTSPAVLESELRSSRMQ
jgi:L-asparaginase II